MAVKDLAVNNDDTDVLDRPAPSTSSDAPSWMPTAGADVYKGDPFGAAKPPEKSIEDMVRPPQAIMDLQREKTQAETKLFKEQSDTLNRDQAETHRRFAQTGIEPGTMEPWDNAKQREKYRTDPLESFGSLGSVFAMIASAFTHAPMENALNGAAAAMNAVRDGNEKEFELAHRAWKENTDLALKRHDIMQRQYENAIQLMSSDMTAGRAKMEMLAASYGDRQLSTLMEAGLWPQGLELMEKRNKVAMDFATATRNIQMNNWADQAFGQVQEKNKREIPDVTQRLVSDMQAAHTIYGLAGGNKAAPAAEEFNVWRILNPGASRDEVTKKLHDLGLAGRFSIGGNAAIENRMMLAYETIQQFEETTGEKLDAAERNMIQQAFQDKTSSGSLKTAALMSGLEDIQTRKANGEKITAEDRARILREHADRGESLRIKQEELRLKQERSDRQQQSKEEGHISDEDIAGMARQYVEAGDTSVKTNLSAGASRGENLARLNGAIERLKREANVSPKEMAARIAKNIGEKQFQRTAGGYAARVETASNEVAQVAPIALDSSEKLSRGKWVPVNTAIQMWQRGTSNETLTEFATNNFALKNAYVRAMNPTGVPRVQERAEAHADGLFLTATSPAAYRVMVQQMIREVQASKKAVQATRDESSLDAEMMKILNQKPPSRRPAGQSAGSALGGQAKPLPTIKTKAEYDKLETGAKFIGEDGNEWTKP